MTPTVGTGRVKGRGVPPPTPLSGENPTQERSSGLMRRSLWSSRISAPRIPLIRCVREPRPPGDGPQPQPSPLCRPICAVVDLIRARPLPWRPLARDAASPMAPSAQAGDPMTRPVIPTTTSSRTTRAGHLHGRLAAGVIGPVLTTGARAGEARMALEPTEIPSSRTIRALRMHLVASMDA